MQINSLLACVAPLWEVLQRRQGALIVLHGLTMGRPSHGLLPCLPAVREGLVPYLPAQSMVRQAFDLFSPLAPGKRFEHCDDAGMERPPPLKQETAVSHLVRQGCLKVYSLSGKSRVS